MTTDADRRDFGMRGLQEGLSRLADAAHDEVPTVVTEILFWAAALDEHYERASGDRGRYLHAQRQHQEGAVMYALRYARGRITHTLDLPGRLIAGVFDPKVFDPRVFDTEAFWQWVDANALGLRPKHGPHDIDRQNYYRQLVEGRRVPDPLPMLLPWFHAAEGLWPSA